MTAKKKSVEVAVPDETKAEPAKGRAASTYFLTALFKGPFTREELEREYASLESKPTIIRGVIVTPRVQTKLIGL